MSESKQEWQQKKLWSSLARLTLAAGGGRRSIRL